MWRRRRAEKATKESAGNGAPPPAQDGETLVVLLDRLEGRLSDLARGMALLEPLLHGAPAHGSPSWPAGEGAAPAELADAGLLDALGALEKQIGRLGREQFKANTLAEAQLERLTSALETLRAADVRHAADMAALREGVQAGQTAARLEVARALLPALDGLDAAVRAGQHVLEPPSPPGTQQEGSADAAPASLLAVVRRLLRGPEAPAAPSPAETALRADLRSWLVGLTFVQQRLLDVLATEGVRPMAAQGQPFDPHLHVALEVVPTDGGVAADTVAAELRRGYLVGDRVLRHAEVAVAKVPQCG